MGRCLADQGVPIRVIDGLHCQIYVQIRTVKMVWLWTSYVADLFSGRFSKPREIFVCEEQLAAIELQPETTVGDVSNVSLQNALSRPCGLLLHIL